MKFYEGKFSFEAATDEEASELFEEASELFEMAMSVLCGLAEREAIRRISHKCLGSCVGIGPMEIPEPDEEKGEG